MRSTGRTCHRPAFSNAFAGVVILLIAFAQLSGCATKAKKGLAAGDDSDLPDIPDAVPKVEPKSKYGNPKSYVVFGKRYYTKATSKGHVERGLASWYGKKFHGRRTSSGEPYDMYAMTAAHKTLPLPTYARVTNVTNGRSAVVKINDRGPFHGKRIIDLSYSAARKLGVVEKGTAMVEVRAIDPSRPDSDRKSKPGGSSSDWLLAADDSRFEVRTAVGEQPTAARKSSPKSNREESTNESDARMARTQPAPKRTAPGAADLAEVKITDTREPPKSAASSETGPAPTGSPANVPSVQAVQVAATRPDDKPSKEAHPSTFLQVGAFGNRVNAEQLRTRLVEHIAEQVKIRAVQTAQAPLYKVQVGPLDSRERATSLSRRLASLGLGDTHIVTE